MIRILATASPGEVRAAAVAHGVLQDYAIWRPGRPDGLGDVCRSRVIAHVPGMAGAFVALPDGEGFLPDSEGSVGALEGALLTVRVTRAAQAGKGARVSAQIEQTQGPPGLVEHGLDPVAELARRYPDATIEASDPALAALLQNSTARAVMVVHGVFDPHEEEVDALASPDVALPGGMRASIHPTPALVAIDMDMAAASAGRGLKPHAQLACNLAAMPALARQIRLRNLSGAILVDPAGLSIKRRAMLAPALLEALAADPLRPRLLGFTALGFIEIQRPRRRPALHEVIAGPHAAALAALRAVARESAATPAAAFHVVAAPEIAEALERDTVARADLAARTGRPLIARPDPALSPCGWRIERGA